jgi:hypothetical protein
VHDERFTEGEVHNLQCLEPGVEDGQPAGGSRLQEHGIFRGAPVPLLAGGLFPFSDFTAAP